jgi:hypothetical protein
MSLLVSIPKLQQDGNASSVLVSEKPIKLSCSPVTFPDGTNLSVLNQPKATFLIYRSLPGGIQQVFDVPGKAWTIPGPSVAPQNLFWDDISKSWQAVVVAIGNQDNSTPPNNIFETNPLTGFPKYAAQCFFTGVDSAGVLQSGQSLLSGPITILAPGQNNLAGLSMDPNDPTQATDIYLFLKDSSYIEQGKVVISQDSAGFHVQLMAGGASVVLSNSGQIVLSPSNSQPVKVNGDISVSGRVLIGGVQVVAP